MALHGNAASAARVPPSLAAPLPQVHRVGAAAGSASSSLRTQQQPLLPRRSQPEAAVSLAQPRPDGERVANDYVEAPLRSPVCAVPPRPPSRTHGAPPQQPRGRLPLPTAAKRPPAVITKQPGKKSEAAECSATAAAAAERPGICPECGECKCNACRGPKALPERWLCNNNVYCSPQATVDYVSCLCCVKAIFYHCSKDYERDDGNAPCADEPCSCAAPRSCARWGCLAALSVVLPCLLCYWPLRAAVAGYEACHNRLTSNRGCRCRPPPLPPSASLEAAASNKALLDGSAADKRLLDSSPE
ncbi:protein sprouty [Neocloeon triangulifer]|uniref:protein sprouty n=1 Tax=Neocloeon triangulifer TaxID=2078957 RepID=UPI00286F85A9|nr:protein sprouty [Neocloeon triangulifer]XP_059489815.1 protein sprouty [Neocloeon triangulifer]